MSYLVSADSSQQDKFAQDDCGPGQQSLQDGPRWEEPEGPLQRCHRQALSPLDDDYRGSVANHFYISTFFGDAYLHFDAVTDHREDLNRKKNSFFWIKHRTSIVDSNALYFDSDPDPEICPNLDLNPSLFP